MHGLDRESPTWVSWSWVLLRKRTRLLHTAPKRERFRTTEGHLHRNHKSEQKKPQPAWPMVIWQSHPGHSLERLDMAPDPLSLLQTVCRRAPKLHLTRLTTEEILDIIFTYKINKINLCSPESDAYRQLFSSFLFLEFQSKYFTVHSLTWDKLVWERTGMD